MDRRDALLHAATDHVLEHGVLGLSLRPLAAAVGTSDRMLIYHFGTKDSLVAAILDAASRRAARVLRDLPAPADLAGTVRGLWTHLNRPPLDRCQRLYVEAAALGLLGRQPYHDAIVASNADWLSALADHLTAGGCPELEAARAAALVEATLIGLALDGPVTDPAFQSRVIDDLVDAVSAIAGTGPAC